MQITLIWIFLSKTVICLITDARERISVPLYMLTGSQEAKFLLENVSWKSNMIFLREYSSFVYSGHNDGIDNLKFVSHIIFADKTIQKEETCRINGRINASNISLFESKTLISRKSTPKAITIDRIKISLSGKGQLSILFEKVTNP